MLLNVKAIRDKMTNKFVQTKKDNKDTEKIRKEHAATFEEAITQTGK